MRFFFSGRGIHLLLEAAQQLQLLCPFKYNYIFQRKFIFLWFVLCISVNVDRTVLCVHSILFPSLLLFPELGVLPGRGMLLPCWCGTATSRCGLRQVSREAAAQQKMFLEMPGWFFPLMKNDFWHTGNVNIHLDREMFRFYRVLSSKWMFSIPSSVFCKENLIIPFAAVQLFSISLCGQLLDFR